MSMWDRRNKTMEETNNQEQVKDVEQTDQQEEQKEETITLTKEELQRKLDSETDKKLEKALKTAKAKWEEEFNKKLEQEKEEAERLAKLSAKERQEEELIKREKQLEKRLKDLERRELKSDAISDLKEKGLPAEFADFLLGKDAEETLNNINSLKKTFDEAVNQAIKEKLKQDVPSANSSEIENDPFEAKLKKYI